MITVMASDNSLPPIDLQELIAAGVRRRLMPVPDG